MTTKPVKPRVILHSSNRAEVLAKALGQLLAAPKGGLLEPETVLVQGRGMATWLGMSLARQHGVCANVDFAYPRTFLWRAFGAVLGPERLDAAELTEQRIAWLILSGLDELLGEAEFAGVQRYLSDDADRSKRFQFARHVASVFDQYLTFRPELIRDWELGHDGEIPERYRWQPKLWRRLSAGLQGHIATLESAFLQELTSTHRDARAASLPQRLTLFGVTSIPPLFVRALVALAGQLELHVFIFDSSPSQGTTPLLQSLGAQGREFRAVLDSTVRDNGGTVQHFSHPERPNTLGMLGRLQSRLFAAGSVGPPGGRNKRQRPGPGELGEQLTLLGIPAAKPVPRRVPLDPHDTTLTVHSCHSPMREVEVLHDQLLGLFNRSDPDANSGKGTPSPSKPLEPQDVIVMTPDIETYAPLIEAVFGKGRGGPHFIPHRISDRAARADNPVFDALRRLVGLVGGRVTSTEVLDLLSLYPIQQRFDLSAADTEIVARWVVDSGIRWGRDASHRASHGQPECANNTWQRGLDRLLLGYAMPVGQAHLFAGVLPYDDIEGQTADLLGRTVEFVSALFGTLDRLSQAQPIAEWRMRLEQALSEMVEYSLANARQHHAIQTALAELESEAQLAGYAGTIPLTEVMALLERRLDDSFPERGFLAGGVTFCALVPMRTIPFRVVALLGMNDGTFPRAHPRLDFDLIGRGATTRRLGDRDRRQDDRQLFLEALMAAREMLILTYTGQSIRDSTERPPSVVVGELLDELALDHEPEGDYAEEASRVEAVARSIVIRHPLQAFDRRYFDGLDPRLFSFSEAFHAAARHAAFKKAPVSPFVSQPLAPPLEQAALERPGRVELDDLLSFWEDPVRSLLLLRLQLRLRDQDLDVPEREPLELDPLETFQVGDLMLRHRLSGVTREHSLELLVASGQLPLGAPGHIAWESLDALVEEIATASERFRTPPGPAAITIDVTLPTGIRLTGEVADLWRDGLVRHRFSKLRAKHLLRGWIEHLAACLSGLTTTTILIGRSPEEGGKHLVVKLLPVSSPEAILADLYGLMQAGLRAPLLFSPRASLAYVRAHRSALEKNRPEPEQLARTAAQREYEAELSFSPHLAKAFRDSRVPFHDLVTEAPPFEELAPRIFCPLLDHLETLT